MIISREFYARSTPTVAVGLLGKRLVRTVDGISLSGIICETEAYGHLDDPDSHAYRRRTDRNAPMFGQVGKTYVYFVYGMHYCFNVVARAPDAEAGAVLVRAIRPERGIDAMMQNRRKGAAVSLADGPAKLTQAMRITALQNGEDLTRSGGIHIEDAGIEPTGISCRRRVGVKTATEWNFSYPRQTGHHP